MEKSAQTKIIPIITAFAIVALSVWLLQSKQWGSARNQAVSLQELSFDLTKKESVNENEVTPFDSGAAMREASVYSHPFGFSFQYPKNFHTSSFPEGDGEIVLVQNDSATVGFQIYVAAFNGDANALTEQNIKKDIPDISIMDPQPVTVTGGGKGVTFVSESGGIKTREVWFVTKGYLYQITANTNSESLLVEVLKTFIF